MLRLLSAAAMYLAVGIAAAADPVDVVIYGGTSAGVVAAVETARSGKTVVLIEPFPHVGGLTVSGLGWTDTGDKRVIGGLSREFYQRLKKRYDDPSAWPHDDQEKFPQYRTGDDAIWVFEPHVAEQVFESMLKEAGITVVRGERIDRTRGREGVARQGTRLTTIRMESGKEFAGRMFIDATYEGDLMALAGVRYTIGRESNAQYGETLNGVQKARAVEHQFVKPVDPYVRPGESASGLLPGINSDPGADGEGDRRVQAYNYRICMTDVPANRIPFQKPAGYDPLDHELLLRNFEAGDLRIPLSIPGLLPNRKTDLNNNFAVSTDWIGMNHDYPEASYEERKRILDAHQTYVRGFLWTLQNDPRVPESVRQDVAKWGFAKDEFTDNNHWPYWCYIREARRMVGEYVQTEMDCRRIRTVEDSVGLGSYNMDSHHVQRYVDEHGHVRNEGDVQVSPGGPYLISYRALTPAKSECTNLLVPVCLSASHAAYGSIRMEPVFMVLGHSAAAAACLAIDGDLDVQDVPYAKLRNKLVREHQVLDLPAGTAGPKTTLQAESLPGIVVDELQAEFTGRWVRSSGTGRYIGDYYLHDGRTTEPRAAKFKVQVPKAGLYELRLSYSAHPNRASNATVVVSLAGDDDRLQVDQRQTPEIDGLFHRLGEYDLDAGGCVVEIRNTGADGYVIVDAVQAVEVP